MHEFQCWKQCKYLTVIIMLTKQAFCLVVYDQPKPEWESVSTSKNGILTEKAVIMTRNIWIGTGFNHIMFYHRISFVKKTCGLLYIYNYVGPFLLTWFNFHPSMDMSCLRDSIQALNLGFFQKWSNRSREVCFVFTQNQFREAGCEFMQSKCREVNLAVIESRSYEANFGGTQSRCCESRLAFTQSRSRETCFLKLAFPEHKISFLKLDFH